MVLPPPLIINNVIMWEGRPSRKKILDAFSVRLFDGVVRAVSVAALADPLDTLIVRTFKPEFAYSVMVAIYVVQQPRLLYDGQNVVALRPRLDFTYHGLANKQD